MPEGVIPQGAALPVCQVVHCPSAWTAEYDSTEHPNPVLTLRDSHTCDPTAVSAFSYDADPTG